MANNDSIQILRGKHNKVVALDKSTLSPGQPLYDLDTQELYVGGGKSFSAYNSSKM